MNKKYLPHDEEINMADAIRTLKMFWSKKIQIILITLVSVLIGVGYSYTSTIKKENLFKIQISKKMNFLDILFLQELLTYENNENINISNINIEFYNNFIRELMDFDELKSISKNYANSRNKSPVFSIVNEQLNNHFILGFAWHDYQESKNIIKQTIKLTSENLKKRIIEKFHYLLKIKRYRTNQKKLERLNYLSEQILIAKKLGLKSSIDYFSSNDQNEVIKGVDNLYLRGYEVLEQEVEIIKNREYDEFDQIQKQINLLKDRDLQFIEYEIFSAEKYSLKNNLDILFLSILLGLIIGMLYSVVFDKSYSNKTY